MADNKLVSVRGGTTIWAARRSNLSQINVSIANSQHSDTRNPPMMTGWFINWASDWGGLVINAVLAVGDFSLFVLRTFTWMFTRLPRRETVWPNFYQVGVSSLPVVALTGTFIGMVLAVQSYFQFRKDPERTERIQRRSRDPERIQKGRAS